jgi:glucokinase
MKPVKRFVLGLDFGGTKLAAGIVDLETNRLIAEARGATPQREGASAAFVQMMKLCEQLEHVDQIDAIGVCFGGFVRQGEVIRSLHVEGYAEFPLRKRLHERFGDCDIRIANDANAVALGEWKFGAGQGVDSMLFLTVSTGIGGGIILGRQLIEGPKGLAGEIGHVIVVPDGRQCPCGRRGCLETVAAGPSMVRTALEMMQQSDMLSLMRNQKALTAIDIDTFANQGDELASQVVREAARHIGTVIGNTVNLLDVERVVIGGGVSRSGALWWNSLNEIVRSIILPWHDNVEIRHSALGKNEGIWGAVALL